MSTWTIANPLGIETFDFWGVLLGDRLALELHRRRQLLAARQPFVAQQRELLDLLHAREAAVGDVHLGLNTLDTLGVAGVLARFGLESQQRHVVGAAIADHAR